MADSKISALPASTTPLAGSEVLPIVQSGATKQVSVANLTAGRAISAASVTASTGNFVVGTSGQGIDFSATPGTGTSELLADYEEGTWTPTVLGTWTTTPVIFGTSTYTKIGRIVTIAFQFTNGAKTLPNNGYFGGVPFTANTVGVGAVTDNNSLDQGISQVSGSSVTVSNLSLPSANAVFLTYFT